MDDVEVGSTRREKFEGEFLCLERTDERNGDLLPDVVMDVDKQENLQLRDVVTREGGTE